MYDFTHTQRHELRKLLQNKETFIFVHTGRKRRKVKEKQTLNAKNKGILLILKNPEY